MPIPHDVMVNFILVDRYKLQEITDSTFTIIVDPGKGEFCNVVTYKYTRIDKYYFLVFDEVRTTKIIETEKKIVNPWSQIVNNCKQD